MSASHPKATEPLRSSEMTLSATSGPSALRQKNSFDHIVGAHDQRLRKSMPSDLAVFVLITKSYLVGACTGYFEISNHRIPCIAPSIRRVAAAAFSFATLVYPIMSPL